MIIDVEVGSLFYLGSRGERGEEGAALRVDSVRPVLPRRRASCAERVMIRPAMEILRRSDG